MQSIQIFKKYQKKWYSLKYFSNVSVLEQEYVLDIFVYCYVFVCVLLNKDLCKNIDLSF